MKRISFAVLAALAASSASAAYPDKPIHWIVPYPPGGTTDVIARNVAQAMSESLGTSIVIDNKAGAGGQIAMNAAARADADGYTLLVSDASLATAPSLYKSLPFDPVKDLVAVALFVTVPHIVVANPKVQAKNLAELIALSKKEPGKLYFSSGGIGSPLHLAGEALRLETGISWTHVPYKGASPAILAVVAGEAQVATPSLPAALPQVQGGKLTALAVSSAKRVASLPDVPSVAEAGYPKAAAFGWVGLHAPAATPKAVMEKLEAAAAEVMKSADMRKRMQGQGADIVSLAGAAYGKLVSDEAARWKAVVQAAGIKPE
ncbi:MAG TPA: tripartite tricarboxylate transporter substrate binding protein [Burkholderiales bacterium]